MSPLTGQKALVTGANSGIGEAVALGRAGADVVVNYVSGEERAEEVAGKIRSSGVAAFAHQADVSREDQVQAMFRRMRERLGTIDILVNNAGLQRDASIHEMTLEQWNTVIGVNLTGQFLCAREAIAEFLRRGVVPQRSRAAGKIVCISSVHQEIPWAGHVNYAASKGGVAMMMRSLAQEVAPRSLRLSTAAHMSARFTYVSPAGTLVKDGQKYGRVVDGGYFENSGATTTLEIALAIDAVAADPAADPRWRKIRPIVIHISNEPVHPDFPPETLAQAAGHPRIAPGRWMPEVLSPLHALLNTRGARGSFARETLRWHVGGENFFHFGLCRESTNVPLGWVLSASTRRNMESQLAGEPCESTDTPPRLIFDNRGNLERLRAIGTPRGA